MLPTKEKIETTVSYLIPEAYFREIEQNTFLVNTILHAERETVGNVRVRLISIGRKGKEILDKHGALYADTFRLLEDSKHLYDSYKKRSLCLLLAKSIGSSVHEASQRDKKTLYLILAIALAIIALAIAGVLLTPASGALWSVAFLVLHVSFFLSVMSSVILVADANAAREAPYDRNKLVSTINGLRNVTSEDRKITTPLLDTKQENESDSKLSITPVSEEASNATAGFGYAKPSAQTRYFFTEDHSKKEPDDASEALRLFISILN